MPTALVTGVSRGLGRHITHGLKAAGYQVLGLGMTPDPNNDDVDDYQVVDLSQLGQPPTLARGRIDLLVNNAAVYLDDPRRNYGDLFALSRTDLRLTLETNLVGPTLLAQHVGAGMLARGQGRVVNISSGMGRLLDADGSSFAYRSSKLALNLLTLTLARHFDEARADLASFSFCPGWIRTDMGLSKAPNSPGPAAAAVVELVGRPADATNGRFFRGHAELGWDLAHDLDRG